MKELVSRVACTNNIDAINSIIDILNKYGRVIVVGKQANKKSKHQKYDNTVFVSDECNVISCGFTQN